MMRFLAGLGALAVVVAACGDDDIASDTTAAGSPAAPEIATRADTAVGTVVVDADGMTLYTAEREADGTVQCVDECLEFWLPALVQTATPSVAADLVERVGTVERPDGDGLQATFDGSPLYRFSEDSAAGETNGDGVEDAFGGAGFVWRAAVVEAPAAGADTTTTAPTPRRIRRLLRRPGGVTTPAG